MITFSILKSNRCNNIVELSFWDMLRLLLGREIAIELPTNLTAMTLRCTKAYQAFNLTAPKA
jgi:hypothetical protein